MNTPVHDFYEEPARDDAIRLLLDRDPKAFQKALGIVADRIGCDRNDMLTMQTRSVQRHGKKIQVLTLRYAYDRRMNDAIKAMGAFWFDQLIKAWNAAEGDGMPEALPQAVADNFAVLIDLDDLTWSRSRTAPVNVQEEVSAFRLIPFHVPVTSDDLQGAIAATRREDGKITHLYVSVGSEFQRYDGRVLHTRMPFLLLRYSTTGRPRYLVYSVLGRAIERVEFGADRGARMVYARYAQTTRETGEPVLASDDGLVTERDGDRAAYRGSPREDAASSWAAIVRPIVPHVLCSDYTTIEETLGADAATFGTEAYVWPRQDAYLRSIAAFFGDDLNRYETPAPREIQERLDAARRNADLPTRSDDGRRVVVVSRRSLSQPHDYMLALVAHEMAHWIIHRQFGDTMYPVHGPEWYCLCAMLQGLLLWKRDRSGKLRVGLDFRLVRERSVSRYFSGMDHKNGPINVDLLQDSFDVHILAGVLNVAENMIDVFGYANVDEILNVSIGVAQTSLEDYEHAALNGSAHHGLNTLFSDPFCTTA